MQSETTIPGPARTSLEDRAWQWVADRCNALPTIALGALPCIVAAALVVPSLGRKSLWLDEAWLANMVLRGGYLNPVELHTTPVGFAVLVAVVVNLTAPTEFWFRATPLTFGVGAVLAVFLAARSLFRARLEAVLAAGLLATNLVAIVYFKNLKSYAADTCFAALIILLAERVITKGRVLDWVLYSLTIVAAPLFSFPSVFVTAIASGTLLVTCTRSRPHRKIVAWFVSHGVTAILLLFYTLTFLRLQRATVLAVVLPSGLDIESALYPEFPDSIVHYVRQTVALVQYFFLPTGSRTEVFVVWGVLVGIYVALRRQPRHVVLLVGPLVLVALASQLKLYAFNGEILGRALLFSLPGLLILAAAGLAAVVRMSSLAKLPAIGILLLGLAFLPGIRVAKAVLTDPFLEVYGVASEEVRDLVTVEIRPELQPGDMAYVSYGAAYAFQFYAPEFRQTGLGWGEHRVVSQDGVSVVFGGIHRASPDMYGVELLSDVNRHAPSRLWLLIAHASEREERVLLAAASRCGAIESVRRDRGGSLFRISVSGADCASAG